MSDLQTAMSRADVVSSESESSTQKRVSRLLKNSQYYI
jgi:hypothetical protein